MNRSSTIETLTPAQNLILLISITIAGFCGLIYELLIGSVGTYLLGNSIIQFSLTIGLMMTAMGIGTFLSRLCIHSLLPWFIGTEILLALIGGLSVPALYGVYATKSIIGYYLVMIFLTLSIGILIGLELPLLTRILEHRHTLKDNISNVLSLDYFGALAATILFPFILLPFLGNYRIGLVTGLINLGVALLNLRWFSTQLPPNFRRHLFGLSFITTLLLMTPLLWADSMLLLWQNGLYADPVIYSQQTRFQKIVLTKRGQDIRLFLNGHLQFASSDEYRYHESLVHVPMGLSPFHENILFLGGGDGLAAKQALQYPDVKKITLIDIDPQMTQLAKTAPFLTKLNQKSLLDSRVKVINQDAYLFLQEQNQTYEIIMADLPDPSHAALARLYSLAFYKNVQKHLSRYGIFVTQATSPFASPKAFWSIVKTLRQANFKTVIPYHLYIPSFGDWGFVLASNFSINPNQWNPPKNPLRFLDKKTFLNLFHFPKDRSEHHVSINTLDASQIISYYHQGWKQWN
ncbi:polyamine aminopropyltransferase [Magnetococcales bacterium HHB-1]